MPAFLTHWRVLIETARRAQHAGSDLDSLIIDASVLRRRLHGLPAPHTPPPAGAVWNTGPLPELDFEFPGSDISAMAYLGALAPDITSYQKGHFHNKMSGLDKQERATLQPHIATTSWHTLFHTNRSSDLLITFLEQIARVSSPALRSQALAFAMGYLTHIATDIALNPWINVLAGMYQGMHIAGQLAPMGLHFYSELCLDEYYARTFFERELYSVGSQPWQGYIEPAARSIINAHGISTQVIELFVQAAKITYGLNEKQTADLQHDFRAGLKRLHAYVAGRGIFRLLALNIRFRRRNADPIINTIAQQQPQPGVTTSADVINYALNISVHLCKETMHYYTELRHNPEAVMEHERIKETLRGELRNWDLQTGYALEVSFDEEITVRLLHNWLHFADLWERSLADIPSESKKR